MIQNLRITVLPENTAGGRGLLAEHGLAACAQILAASPDCFVQLAAGRQVTLVWPVDYVTPCGPPGFFSEADPHFVSVD